MFFLRNLSASKTFQGNPWEFTDIARVPPECLSDKAARTRWATDPDTDYHCYSLFEGLAPGERVNGENPPTLMHGLVVDLDAPTTRAGIDKGVALAGKNKPAWFEQTLSGNGRIIWLFESPLVIPSRKFLVAFLKSIKEICSYDKFVGVDQAALLAPEKYWTNGAQWTKLSGEPVTDRELRGFAFNIANKFNWIAPELGVATSIEKIGEELFRQYPNHNWPGAFVLGAQGPSFWISGSTSPRSAVVKETGLITFSAHASKTFYPWTELVGAEFVTRSDNELVGKAVSEVYYDGKMYFLPGPEEGEIHAVSCDVLRRHLSIGRGLSDRKEKNSPSVVDKALAYIETYNHIEGAASCAFYPKGVFVYNGKRILNTHRIEALRPAPEPAEWGESGGFPFISNFLDTAFQPVEPQRDRFLAWLQYFYRACLARKPCSGHGVFIAGPVGVGKTFFSRGIAAKMVGGCAEAHKYLTGADNFNSELFDHALWVIDDGSPVSTQTMHRLFSEQVKRTVANREHRVNEKFRKAVLAPWQGRILVTCNDDPISIGIIPNLDISILEKLMIFRFGPKSVIFLSQPEMEKIVSGELPEFCRWLLDWEPPGHCFEGAESRFGIMSYCEESLARTANQSSPVSSFAEILIRWLREYFQQQNPSVLFWEGSATDLRISMSSDSAYSELLRGFGNDAIPRILLQLQSKKLFRIDLFETPDGRIFRIHREGRFMKPTATMPPVPELADSKFLKRMI